MARVDVTSKQPKKEEIYADFLTDLSPHPQSADLVKATNERAVNRAIKNLLLTGKYERPFRPEIGAETGQVLFENIDSVSAQELKDKIHDVLSKYEPRIRLAEVEVIPYYDNNAYVANIYYYLINSTTLSSTTITFRRVR